MRLQRAATLRRPPCSRRATRWLRVVCAWNAAVLGHRRWPVRCRRSEVGSKEAARRAEIDAGARRVAGPGVLRPAGQLLGRAGGRRPNAGRRRGGGVRCGGDARVGRGRGCPSRHRDRHAGALTATDELPRSYRTLVTARPDPSLLAACLVGMPNALYAEMDTVRRNGPALHRRESDTLQCTANLRKPATDIA